MTLADDPARRRPATGSSAKVRLRGLSKAFSVKGRRVEALAGIDLDIQAGEFLCVVGPSGCGKTTLLRMLAGLEQQTSGSIEVARDGSSARPLNSMVFQEQSIFPWLSVRDNVAFGLKAQGLGRRERYGIVEPFIRKVGLTGFEDALPHQLSGGMKQRVSIARAFATDPEMLLMDEPFGALDAMTRELMNLELQRIWLERQKTVLFITHSIPEAVFLADRVLVMTTRPGAIMDDVAVRLPRPRALDAMSTSEFGGCVARIRARFNAQGGVDA